MKGSVKVYIEREESIIGFAQALHFKFNGEIKASLMNGERTTIYLEPGKYFVEVYATGIFSTDNKSFNTPFLGSGDEFKFKVGVETTLMKNPIKIYPFKHTSTKGKIFLCYRRKDSEDITSRIEDHLVSVFGSNNILKDTDFIDLGDDFRKKIKKELANCKIMLVIIGKKWFKSNGEISEHVEFEIYNGLQNQIDIIPVLVNGAQIPSYSELPSEIEDLANYNGIHLRGDPDFKHGMQKIIKSIQERL
jgi:TIR domain